MSPVNKIATPSGYSKWLQKENNGKLILYVKKSNNSRSITNQRNIKNLQMKLYNVDGSNAMRRVGKRDMVIMNILKRSTIGTIYEPYNKIAGIKIAQNAYMIYGNNGRVNVLSISRPNANLIKNITGLVGTKQNNSTIDYPNHSRNTLTSIKNGNAQYAARR